MQGEFLSELWGIRRDDPDYRTKVEDAMAALPPALREDPAVEAWWDYSENNLRDIDMRSRAEQQDALIQGRADDRAVVSAVSAAGGSISPERLAELRQKYPDRENYIVAAVAEGSGKKRETTLSDRKEIIDYSHGKAIARIRAYREPQQKAAAIKDFEEKADTQLRTRPNAYPSPVDLLQIAAAAEILKGDATGTKGDIDAAAKKLKGGLKALDAMIGPVALKEAEAQENNLPFLAREKAREYENMEDYVDLVPGLSERDKEARRDIWRVANEVWDAPAEPTEPAPAPAASEAPASDDSQVLDGVTYRKIDGRWVRVGD